MKKVFATIVGTSLALSCGMSAAPLPFMATPHSAAGGFEGLSLVPEGMATPYERVMLPGAGTGCLNPTFSARVERGAGVASYGAPMKAGGTGIDLVGQTATYPGLSFCTFYHVPTALGDFERISTIGVQFSYGAVYDRDDNTVTGVAAGFYAGEFQAGYVVSADLSTGEVIESRSLTNDHLGLLGIGIDKDPVTGRVYGYFYNDTATGYVWGEVDYDSMTRREIKEVGPLDVCGAVGVTAGGQYYGVTQDQKLVKIDKETGETEVVGQVAYPTQYKVAACVNPESDTMLVFGLDATASQSNLYEIELSTGYTSVVREYPAGQLTVMFVVPPSPSNDCPSAPGLSLSAPEGVMTLSYDVALPATLMDGSNATGDIDWTLTDHGDPVASGTGAPGDVVSGEFTFSTPGMKEILLSVRNAAGEGPRVKQRIFIGNGTPASPSGVTAVYADGKIHLAWEPVTASSDGGYVDPQAIRYEVCDQAGTLVSGLSATSYEFDFTAPAERVSFTWYVTAEYNGVESAPASSNEVWFGAYDMPFDKSFEWEELFKAPPFSVIDANGDGNTWTAEAVGAGYLGDRLNDMDDWLVSPELRLEGGKVYPIHCLAFSMIAGYEQRLEIRAGQSPDVDGIDKVVVPVTELANGRPSPAEIGGYFAPETDGVYYIGLHGTSEKRKSGFFITEFHVGEGMSPESPAAPSELVLTPASDASLSVEVSVAAPETSVLGSPLAAGRLDLVVARSEEVVATLSAAPGQTVRYVDNPPQAGIFEYKVTAIIGEHEGSSVAGTVYVGPYEPLAPSGVTISERDDQPGTVFMSWKAPEFDIKDNPLLPSNLTYMVYGQKGNEIVRMLPDEIPETSVTFQAIQDVTQQQFVSFGVSSFNRGLESESITGSDMIAVGKPYQMPVRYSNLVDIELYLLGNVVYNGCVWSYYTSDDTGLVGADYDNLFLASRGESGTYADVFTGKILVDETGAPELSFYMYKFGLEYANTLDVFVMADGQEILLFEVTPSDLKKNGWNRIRLKLDEYKGQVIQVKLRSHTVNHQITAIDVLQVAQTSVYDLCVNAFGAPSKVKAGEEFSVDVSVMNTGSEAARDFNVILYRDGDVCETRQVSSLPSDETLTFHFSQMLSYFDENETNYAIEVEFGLDETPENNITEEITVSRAISKLWVVDDLEGEVREDGNHLSWTTYSADLLSPKTVTESFEDVEAWSYEMPGWTLIEADGAVNGGFYGVDIPGHTVAGDAIGWFVWRGDDLFPGNPQAAAATGEQCLVCLFRSDMDQVDDWAITPRLTMDAQTLLFKVKSHIPISGESLEVYYTLEESLDPDDYILIGKYDNVSDVWTEYAVELPEGTVYAAFRSRASRHFLLMLDDVIFTPDPLNELLVLVGYDIYRDGVKINDAPATGGEYLDTEAFDGSHTYHVVAKYAEGDSELSNAVTLDRSGVDSAMAGSLHVGVEDRDIIVSGAGDQPVAVVSVDGKVLRRVIGDLRLTVTPAVYLVTVGNNTFKLLVR